jgi:hypothetical protein
MTPVALSVERDGTMTVRLSLDDRRALERVLARWTEPTDHDTDPANTARLVTLWRLVRVEPERPHHYPVPSYGMDAPTEPVSGLTPGGSCRETEGERRDRIDREQADAALRLLRWQDDRSTP